MTDATTEFGAILTVMGEAKLSASMGPGVTRLNFSEIGISTGGAAGEFVPDREMAVLSDEAYKTAINSVIADPNDPTKVIVTLLLPALIPDKADGFWCRGIGLYDAAGDLVAVGNIPPAFKPGENQKALRPMKISVRVAVGSAEYVSLLIDQSEVFVTHEHVENVVNNATEVLEGELLDRAGDTGISIKHWKDLAVGNDWTAAVQAALDSDYFHIHLDLPTTAYVNNMNIAKSKRITGNGFLRDRAIWQQVNNPNRGNMFTITAAINYLEVEGIGFVGNRTVQTTTTVTGQDMCAFSARAGSCRNIIFRNCSFVNFGDLAGMAGAAALFGSLSATNQIIENITFEKCLFRDISNVPGVYINADGAYHTTCRNIKFIGNVFLQISAPARQNMIYVLGMGLNNPGHGVTIEDNYVELSQGIDCVSELNYISGFSVQNNVIVYRNAASGTAVLLRETVENGTVADNTILNYGTGNKAADSAAIALVRHVVGKQRNISILDNTVVGFEKPIVLSAGCEDIDVYRNKLFGKSAAEKIISAIEVANANSVRIKDNVTKYALYALELFAGDDILYEGNNLTAVGDGVTGAIAAAAVDAAITNLRIRENSLLSLNAGTPYFINLKLASNVGNRIENNRLPSNVALLNPGYVSSFEAIVYPPQSGTLIAANVYAFDQGQLPMADGEGFTIGANLDGQSPQCVLGDQVIGVSCNQATKGCSIYAWVEAAGVVRIRVQNETGAAVTINPGRWRVTIAKASLMVS